MSRIVVFGMGARTPFGVGADALLAGLCTGRTAIERYEPFVTAGVRAPVAAAVADATLDARAVPLHSDRAARLLDGALGDALEDATGARTLAALGAADIAPARVALVAGTSSSGIGPFCAAQAAGAPRAEDDARYASAAQAVARRYGVAGPVLVVCSVCASGALAIAEAAELLEAGHVEVALAAGFDPLEPFVGAGFDSLSALTDAPRPFRADRRGLALGEGAAAVVLGRADGPLARLRARPRGVLLGWGASADAHHLTAPDPRGAGVALAITRALARAGVTPADVGAVNAHGTGTPFNDAMESAALATVFGPRGGGVPVYTVKGTIGHTLGAAGAIEAVASLAAMEAHTLPPTVTEGPLDPRCDVELVAGAPRASEARVTLSLSSAFGGANCALVLGAADAAQPRATAPGASHPVVVRASAVWVGGRFVERAEDLAAAAREAQARGANEPRAALVIEGGFGAARLPRADRVTQLGGVVLARALAGLAPCAADEVSVLTASALATADTNERFEARRREGRAAEPRSFPYTAPNAAAGELAIAAAARGPTVALVGDAEVGVAALERAVAWVARGRCRRALVVATECPPERPALVAPRGVAPVECAVAVVVERADDAEARGARVSAGFSAVDPARRATPGPLLSVDALARVALAARDASAATTRVEATAGAGADVWVAIARGA